ncbi:Uncharacterized protein APZ42_002180, partial [Daphnia magna]
LPYSWAQRDADARSRGGELFSIPARLLLSPLFTYHYLCVLTIPL